MKVQLKKSSLLQDLEDGLTRPEMAEKYGLNQLQLAKAMKAAGLMGKKYDLNPQQLAKAMKAAGLMGKRAKVSAFELVDDTVETPTIQQVVDAGYSVQQAQEITGQTFNTFN